MVTQTTNGITEDVAFAVTRHGKIALWNHAAEEVLGYSAPEAIGQHCWKLLSGQDIYSNPYCSEHCTLREKAFQHGSVNTYQTSFKTNSDERKLFSINCLLVFTGAEKEWLLHICNPEKKAVQSGSSNTMPISSHKADLLTKRETEVLNFLTAGKSTHQIASILGISAFTVRNHVQHILKKLKVHSRLEAIMFMKGLSKA